MTAEEPERKKAKKNRRQKDSESHRSTGGEVGEGNRDAHKKKEACKKSSGSSSSGKLAEQPHSGKVGVSVCRLPRRKVWFVLRSLTGNSL